MSMKSSTPNSRRSFLLKTSALSISSVVYVNSYASSHCNTIDLLIAQAIDQNRNAGAWALTVSTDAITRLDIEVGKLEERLATVEKLSDQAEFDAYLSGINATISLGFAIAGVYATGAVVPILFIGSIAVGGTMLIADAIISPGTPEGMTVAQDVGINRVGGLLSIAGDDAYAISTNAVNYSSKAGKLLGFIGAGIAAFEAAQKLGASSARSKQERNLKAMLATMKGELELLKSIEYMTEVRKACTKAVEVDLTRAYPLQVPKCIIG